MSLASLQGAVVVDQQVGHSGVFFYGVYLRDSESAGQSFTPSQDSVQFITINTLTSADFNMPVQATLRISLYTGEDRSMGAIATSSDILFQSHEVQWTSGGFTFVDNVVDPLTWILDAPVSLTAGNRYSFHVDHVSGDDLMWTASWESYSGGRALFTNILEGAENQLMNFSFSEGTVVPEPESFLLFPVGMLLLWSRRKSEQAVGCNRRQRPSLNSDSPPPVHPL